MADADIEVDNIIEQLLSVRGARPGRQVNLTEAEIRWLCIKSKDVFSQQPVLLELEAPIKICGKHFEFCPSLTSFIVTSNRFLFFLNFVTRRYPWSVFRPITSLRVWWIPTHRQLSVLGVRY